MMAGLLSMIPMTSFAVSLTVDINKTHQEIDNFGASDAWAINPAIKKWMAEGNDQSIEQLADLLFSTDKGIGLTAWRMNIGAGSTEQGDNSFIPDPYRRNELLMPEAGGKIDTTKQLGQIRFLQEAKKRGVQDFIAFLNSPPVWATRNGLTHPRKTDDLGSTNLDMTRLDDFSSFMVSVLEYLRSEEVGVPVNYISPINEPTWEWEEQTQEGNRYNIDEMKRVYKSLHEKLKEKDLHNTVHIDGGEVVEFTAAINDSYYNNFDEQEVSYNGGMNKYGVGLYRNYIDELLGDKEIRSIIGNQISLHGYFSDAWKERMGNLRDMTYDNVKAVSPDAKIWMSEMSILGGAGDVRSFEGHGFKADDLDYSLHLAKIIHRDMTRLNASAWQWWLAFTPYEYKDGLVKVNSELEADSLKEAKALWTVGQFSKFIRPGYKRISVENPDDLDGIMASAYISPDSEKLVLVVINAGDKEEIAQIMPRGFEQIKLNSAYITNAEFDLEKLEKLKSNSNQFVIPARSVVTYTLEL